MDNKIKGGQMEVIIKTAKGINGQLELLENKIRIKRKGLSAIMMHGFKGDKEIFIKQISSIQYKKTGLLTHGYIQFVFLGSQESKAGYNASFQDENTVVFKSGQQNDFDEIKELIERKISQPESSTSGVSDLEKLADLKAKGIITEEEFSLKKKQILGI